MNEQRINLNMHGKIGCKGFVMSRITMNSGEKKARSILVCQQERDFIDGYAGYFFLSDYLSKSIQVRMKRDNHPFLYGVERALELEEDDVVVVNEQSGVIHRIYRSGSRDNAIMLTNICNSNCIFCPESEGSRSRKEETPFGFFRELITLIPKKAEQLCLTGGEPTCAKQGFIEVVKLCNQHLPNTKLQILSNSRAFSVKSYARQLAKVLPDSVLLGTALHSHLAEVHDGVTQVPGSFQQTIQGIRNIISMNVQVEVRIVICEQNADHLVDLVHFIHRELKGVHRITFMGMELLGNAARNKASVWADYMAANGELKAAVLTCVSLGLQPAIFNIPLCAMDESIWQFSHRSISDYKVFYPETCEACQVKRYCSGFFRSTYQLMKPEARLQYVRES